MTGVQTCALPIFIARLRAGDCFVFAGRLLEYVRTQEMTAYVKRAEKTKGRVTSWAGAKMPLSSELADAVLDVLARFAQGETTTDPEIEAARPMLETQLKLSRLPTPQTLLIERLVSKKGQHLFLYPFAGRAAHIGLASPALYPQFARPRLSLPRTKPSHRVMS